METITISIVTARRLVMGLQGLWPGRRWGYYTLPILYGDRLERETNTLVINGFWLEDHAPQGSPEFAEELARGLAYFAAFLRAQCVRIAAIMPQALREWIQAAARQNIEIRT